MFAGMRRKQQWKSAQQAELRWWHGVSQTGYNHQTPDDFIRSGQRDWLLSQLEFLERPMEYWEDKTIVEFGPGPAGFVEYITAARKIAAEPLIEEYRRSFPHLRVSAVEYLPRAGEDASSIASEIADLSICFNVLDHTFAPEKLIHHLSRVTKPGGDLLFQVNVYLSPEEIAAKSGEHAKLHPYSFYPQDIETMLRAAHFEITKSRCSEDTNDCGEHYFICAGKKVS